ncbi:MAG: hypothetical protein Q8J89_06710 [Caulobacter sp.]|nr:hypothetical protein [Caulobacter sp.]
MSKYALRRPCDESDRPSIQALTIDLGMHQHLLAILIGAVDRLPGGSGALAGATGDLDGREAFDAALSEVPDPSAPMARQFLAAHRAEPVDRATRAAQARATTITGRQEARHVD